MSSYVDGFVLPLPRDGVATYREIATKAAALWREHGALEYRECVLEDPLAQDMVTFPQLAGAGEGETVVLAWITYESRAHRDEVNARVMADSRLQEMCKDAPFNYHRMAYGGFATLVSA